MSSSSKKSFIAILFAVIAVAAIFYLFRHQKANAPEASTVVPAITDVKTEVPLNSSWPADTIITTKVLMYHHVGPLPENPDATRTGLTVSVEKFENQIKFLLDNGYTFITLSGMNEKILNSEPMEKNVVLTFDDGYKDNFEYAWPIMKKYSVKGTFFIITSFLGRDDTMTEANIIELAKNGNEIGSHTKTHPSLERLSGEKTNIELLGSKEFLEKLIGQSVLSLCYPAGKYNELTIETAKNTGYKMAVTTKSGKPFSTNAPFEIPRYRMAESANISSILK